MDAGQKIKLFMGKG